MKFLILSLFPLIIYSQQFIEQEVDSAVYNCKRGVYWALANLDSGKTHVDGELVSDNKLYADVRLLREYNGVKIESTGFYNSTDISVKLYLSDDYLIRNGYLKAAPEQPGKKKKKQL